MATTAMVRREKRHRMSRRKNRWWFWLLIPFMIVLIIAALYFLLIFPKEMQRMNYPIAYRTEIEKYAKEYSLDPARVQAVVFTESSNRAEAVSNADARGLMQIIPSTGEWIATKLGHTDFTPDQLFDVDTNLNYGCWYLNYLDNRYEFDLTKATAAYHTGPGNLDKWLQDESNSADGKVLHTIPSNATDTYVKRVKLAYEQYKERYANES